MSNVSPELESTSAEILPSGTVTFLFTDIEGSTKLAQQYADEMPALLARHHAILNHAIAAHDGFAFQIVGDSYAVAFHNASDALGAALDTQRALYQEAWSPAPIKVRMGIHTGTAQVQPAGTTPRYAGYATLAQSQRVMSVGHGGQVLLSQVSAELVGDRLPAGVRLIDMRERRLKDIAQPVHLYQANAPDLPSEFAPLATADQIYHNLPSELTPFVGREMELRALETLVGDSHNRLVTIVAQGGMGKTRLALQVATQLIGAFPQGLYFVELDRINSPEAIVQAVAQVLPISLASNEDPKTRVVEYLRDKSVLLVLDNFEHVLDGASFVQEILTAAPRVQVLATSRLRLHLTSETVFNIGGLTIGAAPIEQDSAIQLFVQSARRTRPQFELNAEVLPAVIRICRMVEGMPLAIVLAAAWINTLTVWEICDEIGKSIDMLETEQRDVPDRQRSVRAVIESSWNQVDGAAQNQMKRLSVFRGGFTRAAAEQVAGASLRGLSQLVDRALLRRDPETGRYSIHELLRQYAQEQLEQSSDELKSAHEVHAKYFADFMQTAAQHIRASSQIVTLSEIEADLDNIRLAWNYWSDRQDANRLLRFIFALWFFFEVRSSVIPALQLFEAAAQKLTLNEPDVVCVRAEIRVRQAWFTALIGQPVRGLQTAEENIAILRQHNRDVSVFTLGGIAVNAIWLNQVELMDRISQEMVGRAEQGGIAFEQGWALIWRAYAFLMKQQVDRALQAAEQGLAISRELDNPFALAWAEGNVGVCWTAQGRLDTAKSHYLSAVQQAERIHFDRMLLISSETLGGLALMEHDFEQAQQFSLQSLRLSHSSGQTREMLASLRDLAAVYVAQGNPQQALELLAVVLNHPASDQHSLNHSEPLRQEADRLRSQIESEMDPSLYQAVWDRAQQRQRDQVLTQLLDYASLIPSVV